MKALHRCGKRSSQNKKSYLRFTPRKSLHKKRTECDLDKEERYHPEARDIIR